MDLIYTIIEFFRGVGDYLATAFDKTFIREARYMMFLYGL